MGSNWMPLNHATEDETLIACSNSAHPQTSYLLWLGTGAFLLGLVVLAAETSARADTPVVAGYLETVRFVGHQAVFEAKLDTGATSSSINATDVTIVRKNAGNWVRFTLRGGSGNTITLERRVERIVRIRRSGVGVQERPVVMLAVCVAGRTAETAFNLADRTKMDAPVLIGRAFLAGRILVDSGKRYQHKEACPPPAASKH